MINKAILSFTVGLSLLSLPQLHAQSQPSQSIEIIIDNGLNIDDYKLSPSRIPYIYAELNTQEKENFTIYGQVVAVDNDGKWIRIATNEVVDDIHCYVQANSNGTFNNSMLGKYVTARGNINEITLDPAELSSKNSNSVQWNNTTNHHTHLAPTYQVEANSLLISSPY